MSETVPKRVLRMPAMMRLVDCADCGRELLGQSMQSWANEVRPEHRSLFPQLVAGRINDRPYCVECLHRLEAIMRHRKRKADASSR